MAYKDERANAGFSSSLLFLSTTGSSRLMTFLPVNHFSNGFVFLTHVLSPLPQLSMARQIQQRQTLIMIIKIYKFTAIWCRCGCNERATAKRPLC